MVTINQSDEPQELISLAKSFGFEVRVTGGLFLTHEIQCTQNDLIALREICPTMLAPDKGQAAVVEDNQAIASCG